MFIKESSLKNDTGGSVSWPVLSQPVPGDRDWYLFEAVRSVPRLLQMLDRNPASPTYGCFDREYWHYRTADFPCAMNEEFALGLALAWQTAHPLNPYHHNVRLRELVLAAMHFARRAAHRDGSGDDYFPGEKARGAVSFSLYALTECYQILGLQEPELLEFFTRRADWLCRHQESGQLANHQALGALALATVHQLTGEPQFRAESEALTTLTLQWQNAEGWFQEYEGADPGYQTCTISFLAKLRQKTGDARLTPALQRAAEFAAQFGHPDGSFAGEYGSRNTHHYYAHGLELLAGESAAARRLADAHLFRALPRRTRYFNDDNRMCGHYVPEWFAAWRDYAAMPGRGEPVTEPRTVWFPNAGLLAAHERTHCVVASAPKGGVLRVITESGPIYADTGVMVQLDDGRTLVAHLYQAGNEATWDAAQRTLTVAGGLCRRRAPMMTPVKQMVFRLLALTLGQLNPNWLRLLVQKLFITGKLTTAARFRRVIRLGADRVEITDEVTLNGVGRPVAVLAAPESTSIYVASSNPYQAINLLPVRRLESLLRGLQQTGQGRETVTIPVTGPGALLS
jgi:hypothetical protein